MAVAPLAQVFCTAPGEMWISSEAPDALLVVTAGRKATSHQTSQEFSTKPVSDRRRAHFNVGPAAPNGRTLRGALALHARSRLPQWPSAFPMRTRARLPDDSRLSRVPPRL
jgi:hypothetical protein